MSASNAQAQRVLNLLKQLGGDPKEVKTAREGELRFEAFGGCKFMLCNQTVSLSSDEELWGSVVGLARAGTGNEAIGADGGPKEPELEDKKVRKQKAKIMETGLDEAGSDDEHKTAVLEDME